MKRCIYLAVVLALSLGVSNVGAVSITGNESPAFQVPDALGNLGGGLLDVYQITVNSDSAANVTAVDITFTGTFAQAQNFSFGVHIASPLEADVVAFGAAAVAQDTHFVANLLLPGAPEPPPTEGLIAPPLGFPGSGLSDNLISNKVAIAGVDQAPSILLAQIVVLAGTPGPFGDFVGTVAVQGNPNPVPVGGVLGVPEPSSLILAGLSLVAVFSSRRRLA